MLKNASDETPFISVIIPNFNRFHYLEETIRSIHEHADFPFELLVHDDGSNDGTEERIRTLKGSISTSIFNYGLNMGLSESINRLVRLAGSNYILMLNADMEVKKRFFGDVFNILQKTYIGYITPLGTYVSQSNTLKAKESTYVLTRGIGSGCALAFRKDTWNQVGGWNNSTVATGNADVSFMTRVLKAGYFAATLIKPSPVLENMSMDRVRNTDSTIGTVQCDCSLPRLFNSMEYQQLSKSRYSNASNSMQISYLEPAGETNIHWWHTFMNMLITEEHKVDWKIAENFNFGHLQWKDMIENAD